MIVIGRHLDRELPLGSQRRDPPLDHRTVVRDPLQCRVREHQVVIAADVHREMSPYSKSTSTRPCEAATLQHRRRVVDTGHATDAEPFGGVDGERPGAATEIDGTLDAARMDHLDEVPERLRPLHGEPLVLRRVPIDTGHGPRLATCI